MDVQPTDGLLFLSTLLHSAHIFRKDALPSPAAAYLWILLRSHVPYAVKSQDFQASDMVLTCYR